MTYETKYSPIHGMFISALPTPRRSGDVPVSRLELRVVVEAFRRAQQRVLAEQDMGPRNWHQGLHVRSPGSLVRKPLHQATPAGPQHPVPVAQDVRWRHDVFEAVERHQCVKRAIRERQGLSGADFEREVHRRNHRVDRLPRPRPTDGRRVEVDSHHSPRLLALSQIQAQFPIAASEVQHILATNVFVAERRPT
jgi:hypothetical protein